MSDVAASARAYARFWEELTPATAARFLEVAHPEVRFRDPFNDIQGADRVVALLEHMFEQLGDVAFSVEDEALCGRKAFLRWSFHCRLKHWPRTRPFVIEGVSEVVFDEAGLALLHVDHWDAAGQVYERVPLLGGALRLVRRRLAFQG